MFKLTPRFSDYALQVAQHWVFSGGDSSSLFHIRIATFVEDELRKYGENIKLRFVDSFSDRDFMARFLVRGRQTIHTLREAKLRWGKT